MWPTPSGKHTTHMSSKLAKRWFVKHQEILKKEQSAMLSEGVQHGHDECIALLSPFALVDHRGVTAVVRPEVLGRVGVKLEHERKHSVAPTDLLESVQHRFSGFHVKRTKKQNTVARLSRSVKDWMACATLSPPALVVNAY